MSDNNMGMTNKQFNGFIRFVINALIEVHDAMTDSPPKAKLDEIIHILQDTLEDSGS